MDTHDRAPARDARARVRSTPRSARSSACVATLLGLIVLAWAILFVTKGRFLKPTFVKYASRYADRAVAVGGDFQLYFNPFHLKFLAQGLTLANPAWAHDRQLFTARLIDTEISTWDLIFGRQHVLFLDARRRQRRAGDRQGGAQHLDLRRQHAVQGAADRPRDGHRQRRSIIIDAKHKADVRLTFGDLAGSVNGRGKRAGRRGPLTFRGGGTALGRPVHPARRADDAQLDDHRRHDRARPPRQCRPDARSTSPARCPARRGSTAPTCSVTIAGKNLQTLFKLSAATAPATRPYKLAAHFTKTGSD